MTTTTAPNKPTRLGLIGSDQHIILGIKQDLQSMTSLPLGGSTYTPTSLAAAIQSRIDAANAVTEAKAAWQSAAKTYKGVDTQVTVLVRELKQLVIGAFGPASLKLADFGFAAPKKAVLTVEEKAAKAAKAKATRLARGTTSKKAKAKITGVTAAAAAAQAAAAAAATPAQAAAPAPVAQAAVATAPAAVAPVVSAAAATAPAAVAPVVTAPAAVIAPVTTPAVVTAPVAAAALAPTPKA